MEPEVSLQQSQVPATCPYPEPARSGQLTLFTDIIVMHKNTKCSKLQFLEVAADGTTVL
jgi:hypothetical protein